MSIGTVVGLLILLLLIAVFGETVMMLLRSIIFAKEMPEKIIGQKVRLRQFEGLGPSPPDTLFGYISNFSEGVYQIDFEEPFYLHNNQPETYAKIRARHGGFPVSRVSKRRILTVGGKFESGTGFIALIRKA